MLTYDIFIIFSFVFYQIVIHQVAVAILNNKDWMVTSTLQRNWDKFYVCFADNKKIKK